VLLAAISDCPYCFWTLGKPTTPCYRVHVMAVLLQDYYSKFLRIRICK
jgi:hypothetical protein